MSAKAIETTVQKFHQWLESVRGNLGLRTTPDGAYSALRAVLHALRDRLSVESAAHLAAQLPMLVRGLFFEGWDPTDKPLKIRTRDDFLDLVESRLDTKEWLAAEDAVVAVFRALEQHVDPGEMAKLEKQLPDEVRQLLHVGSRH